MFKSIIVEGDSNEPKLENKIGSIFVGEENGSKWPAKPLWKPNNNNVLDHIGEYIKSGNIAIEDILADNKSTTTELKASLAEYITSILVNESEKHSARNKKTNPTKSEDDKANYQKDIDLTNGPKLVEILQSLVFKNHEKDNYREKDGIFNKSTKSESNLKPALKGLLENIFALSDKENDGDIPDFMSAILVGEREKQSKDAFNGNSSPILDKGNKTPQDASKKDNHEHILEDVVENKLNRNKNGICNEKNEESTIKHWLNDIISKTSAVEQTELENIEYLSSLLVDDIYHTSNTEKHYHAQSDSRIQGNQQSSSEKDTEKSADEKLSLSNFLSDIFPSKEAKDSQENEKHWDKMSRKEYPELEEYADKLWSKFKGIFVDNV
jgi:uncharacterized protein (DUF1697 family)